MAEVVSLQGPVECVDGELVLLIPLAAGGDVLAPLAKGTGKIDGEFLKVSSRRGWLRSFESKLAASSSSTT